MGILQLSLFCTGAEMKVWQGTGSPSDALTNTGTGLAVTFLLEYAQWVRSEIFHLTSDERART